MSDATQSGATSTRESGATSGFEPDEAEVFGGTPRLTSLSPGAGCGCKLGAAALGRVLADLPVPTHPDLIVGTDTGDDAMVWRRPDGRSLVATTDFFTPIVDDPATWGRIAAANAASDVFAMGARPLFGLNLAAWPSALPLDGLAEVLSGGAEIASLGGWVVGGGHTIDISEPLYGQAIIGELGEHGPLTNDGARPGDVLVLTKAIGTGVITTAVKRSPLSAVADDGELAAAYDAAVESMTRLNDAAAEVAVARGAHAVTDVTGFGLAGHLHKMMAASETSAVVEVSRVPLLAGVDELMDAGMIPGGTARNLEFVAQRLIHADGSDSPQGRSAADESRGDSQLRLDSLLADPQTSGGLLLALPADRAEIALEELLASGHDAALIGEVLPAGGNNGRVGDLLIR